jgi:integrase
MVGQKSPYIFAKRGIFYFTRRVPRDLKRHYRQGRVTISLRTRSQRAAQARATMLVAKLDEDWLTLRWRTSNDPFSRFLVGSGDVGATPSNAPLLSEAKDLYLIVKGKGRPKSFQQSADRAVNYAVGLLGDRPLDSYSRSEVNQLRDMLAKRGLGRASLKRNFSVLRAMVNFTTRENGLPDINTFSGIYLGEDDGLASNKRLSIPIGDIRRVQAMCRTVDDEARWLIALISDTGMRLSEAAGLLVEDLCLEGIHPYVSLKAYPWRRLKTGGSARGVPLVGASLWAAKQAAANARGRFLFPRYCSEKGCKANSASAALNKWLAPRVPDGCVVHSFQHSMRDRLRAVECPMDIIDRIGGWAVSGVGESYGQGYPIKVIVKWMKKACAEGIPDE